jgi:hypothetical protein
MWGREKGMEEIGDYPGEWPVVCALGQGIDEMRFCSIGGRGADCLICNSASWHIVKGWANVRPVFMRSNGLQRESD